MPNINEEPPETAQLVECVLLNMNSLYTLLNILSPSMVIIHLVIGPLWIAYGLGDAKGEGSVGQLAPTYLISRIEIYFWCTEDSEKSSNNREMKNCYRFLKRDAEVLRLTGNKV